jgi:hypothetical protein
LIDDLKKGIFPNIISERGWTAEWKYNRQGFLQNIALGIAVASGLLLWMQLGRNKD